MPVFTAIAAIASVVAGVGAAAAGAVGLTVGAVGATMIGGGIIGACIGGAVAAVKGENILKGALKGGLWGAAAGGALGMAAGSLAGGAAGTSAVTQSSMGTGLVGEMTGAEIIGTTTMAGVTPAASQGGLAAFWGGLSGSDKTLLLSAGMGAIESATSPDEMDILERKAELERQALKISGLPDMDTFRQKVDWNRFAKVEIPSKGAFENNFTPELFDNDATHSDANRYQIAAPTTVAKVDAKAPKPTGYTQAPSGSAPKPQSMLG